MMQDTNFGVCCIKCQLYGICETKWYRGERQEKDVCCKLCEHYDECLIESVRKKARARLVK